MCQASLASFSAHGSSESKRSGEGASDDACIPNRNTRRGGCKMHLSHAVPEQIGLLVCCYNSRVHEARHFMPKRENLCSGYFHIHPHGIIGTTSPAQTHPEPQRFINSSVDLLPHGYLGTYLGHLAIHTDLQVISRRAHPGGRASSS